VSDLAELAARAAPKPPAGIVLARARAGGAVEVAAAGPVEPDAAFELGSITKAVTGLLLADAVVRGEVALETTLDECLPGARALRLGDLASHSAGLPRLSRAFVRRTFKHRSDPYAGTTVTGLVDDLAGVRVRRRRRPRYSNLGAALLGQALAARAGAPYEQLVHERVLGPLGVSELWAREGPPVAQPHDRRGRAVPPWTMDAYAPAGCLHGTARGALALATACMTPLPAMADAVALALTPRSRRLTMQFGLGWIRSPARRGVRMWWHNGGTGGSRSFTAFIPATGEAVAAVTNSQRPPDATAKRAWSEPRGRAL
jgi:D-alanyl-D-alanine-carboxypeptidase/D-alanyl-D-alanine-endopeptidase